jgi:hypothetical protein
MNSASPVGWKRQIIAILLFGVSFGHVAAVVTYLRPQFDAARATFIRQSRDLFPMLSPQQVRAAGPDMVRSVDTEVAREAATMLMLGAVAAAVGSNFQRGVGVLSAGFRNSGYFLLCHFEGFDRLAKVAADLGHLISCPRASVRTRARACVGCLDEGRNGARPSVAGIKRSFHSARG